MGESKPFSSLLCKLGCVGPSAVVGSSSAAIIASSLLEDPDWFVTQSSPPTLKQELRAQGNKSLARPTAGTAEDLSLPVLTYL